jgi:hypothetical protein
MNFDYPLTYLPLLGKRYENAFLSKPIDLGLICPKTIFKLTINLIGLECNAARKFSVTSVYRFEVSSLVIRPVFHSVISAFASYIAFSQGIINIFIGRFSCQLLQ